MLRAKLEAAGTADRVELDSAGTHDYHVGRAPDRRAQRHALARGYDLSALRARRAEAADFERFDLLLAMDEQNRRACAPSVRPGEDRMRLLMSFATRHDAAEVPDPYYGGDAGFERVLDYIEDACDGVVASLGARLGLR